MAQILRRNAKISKALRDLTSEKLQEDDLELIEVLKVSLSQITEELVQLRPSPPPRATAGHLRALPVPGVGH